MITLNEAKKKALAFIGNGMEISQVRENAEAWIFCFRCAQTNEAPDISPIMVFKKDGKLDVFFPPDHEEELSSMKLVESIED